MATQQRNTFTQRRPSTQILAAGADPIFAYLLEQNQTKIDIYEDGLRDVGAAADEGVANAQWSNPYGPVSAILVLDGAAQLFVALTPIGAEAEALVKGSKN